jgi:hypothetical protein
MNILKMALSLGLVYVIVMLEHVTNIAKWLVRKMKVVEPGYLTGAIFHDESYLTADGNRFVQIRVGGFGYSLHGDEFAAEFRPWIKAAGHKVFAKCEELSPDLAFTLLPPAEFTQPVEVVAEAAPQSTLFEAATSILPQVPTISPPVVATVGE